MLVPNGYPGEGIVSLNTSPSSSLRGIESLGSVPINAFCSLVNVPYLNSLPGAELRGMKKLYILRNHRTVKLP